MMQEVGHPRNLTPGPVREAHLPLPASADDLTCRAYELLECVTVEEARWLLRLDRAARGRRGTPKSIRPRCGARTRSGRPCEASAVWDVERDCPRNGRCRMHGGVSTGPRTEEGRGRAAAAARAWWGERRRQEALAQGLDPDLHELAWQIRKGRARLLPRKGVADA